jgi:hypothetical protein
VGRDRQLDQAVPVGGRIGHGVAAGVAHAVDLHAELGVLTGRKPVQLPLGRRVSVTLRGVVRTTRTTLARTSVDDHDGRTSST